MAEKENQLDHTPVLMQQVLQYLDPKPKQKYLDVTAGYGGHAQAIRARTNGWSMTLVDRDQMAINYLKKTFTDEAVEIIHEDFLTATKRLVARGQKFDLILADLGVSSPHLNNASRGFAIKKDGPLDMRMDQSQVLTAEKIVNTYSEAALVRIIREYGEEPRSIKIARAIITARPMKTTYQLATIIAKQFRGYHKVHPATKTFQALRIAVNNEISLLEQAIPLWIDLLEPNGRLGVISFHSLEDRIVKRIFSEKSGLRYDAELTVLTKRPCVADKHEVVSNPRARSAKLRVAVKNKN